MRNHWHLYQIDIVKEIEKNMELYSRIEFPMQEDVDIFRGSRLFGQPLDCSTKAADGGAKIWQLD
jgi:hypothetical protein